MILVDLTGRVQLGERSFVIFHLKRGLADVVMSHRGSRAFRKFFQKLTKRFTHSLWILLLTKNERFVLQCLFAVARSGIFRQHRIPIGESRVIILVVLVCFGPPGKGPGRERTIRKSLDEKSKRLDDSRDVLHLQITRAELIRRFGAKFGRELRSAQFRKNRRGARIILLLIKRLGFEQFRLIGPFDRRIGSQKLIDLGRKRGGIRIINVNETLERRIFRFFAIWMFVDDFAIKRFRFLGVSELTLAVRREQHYFRAHFFRKLLLRFFVIAQELRELTRLILHFHDAKLSQWMPAARLGQRPAFLKQRHRFIRHALVDLAPVRLQKIQRDQTGADSRFGFQCRFLCFVGERLVLLQRVCFSSARERDAGRGFTRVLAIRIRIFRLGDLLINVASLVLVIERFETTRFEIMRGKRNCGVF